MVTVRIVPLKLQTLADLPNGTWARVRIGGISQVLISYCRRGLDVYKFLDGWPVTCKVLPDQVQVVKVCGPLQIPPAKDEPKPAKTLADVRPFMLCKCGATLRGMWKDTRGHVWAYDQEGRPFYTTKRPDEYIVEKVIGEIVFEDKAEGGK